MFILRFNTLITVTGEANNYINFKIKLAFEATEARKLKHDEKIISHYN